MDRGRWCGGGCCGRGRHVDDEVVSPLQLGIITLSRTGWMKYDGRENWD